MVYLIVFLALVALTVKGYCGKRISTDAQGVFDTSVFNLLRLVMCALIGFCIVLAGNAGASLAVDGGMLWICVLAGASNAAFLVGWMLAVQKNTMVAVDVTLTLGALLPAVLCAVFFDEPITLGKLGGFALIFVASIVLSSRKKCVKKKTGFLPVFLLVFAALGDGLTGFSQQLFKQFYTKNGIRAGEQIYPDAVYHFYTYVFAALILLLVLIGLVLVRRRRGKTLSSRRGAYLHALPYIAVMALCLFGANYAQTTATGAFGMPSQVLYPVIKGGCLVTANVTALFFGERFTRRSALGTAIALCGIVCLNLL